jgi:hypothetical protein
MALSLPLPQARPRPAAVARRLARWTMRQLARVLRQVVWPLCWQGGLFLLTLGLALLPAVRLLPLPSHPDHDMSHFRLWIAWLTANGVEAAYAGLFPAQYVIYPPLMPYFYHLVGQLLTALPQPPPALTGLWPEDGFWVEAVVRTPVVGFHALLASVIYWSTARWKGHLAAVAATVLYAANPAVLFDLVYWAQPDSYHSFFIVVGLLFLLGRWPEFGWAAFAFAALAKPQAWVYLPALLLVTWRRHGFAKVLSGSVFFLTAALLVVWPYLAAGRGWEMASVFINFSRVMPVVTANAHNLWWLVLGQPGLSVADSALVFGPFSYQTVGLLLFLAAFTLGQLTMLGDPSRETLFGTAGFLSLAFFLFSTQVHENHAFLVFPLLALCWPASVRLLVVYLLLSLSMLANLALHDPLLEPQLPTLLASWTAGWLPDPLAAWVDPERLSLLGTVLNGVAFALWLSWLFWRPGHAAVPPQERQRRAGWGALVGGAATLAGGALAALLILTPAPPPGTPPPDRLLDGRISLKPVEEPYLRITLGGKGTTDPAAQRQQWLILALGGPLVVATVALAYASYQGLARSSPQQSWRTRAAIASADRSARRT